MANENDDKKGEQHQRRDQAHEDYSRYGSVFDRAATTHDLCVDLSVGAAKLQLMIVEVAAHGTGLDRKLLERLPHGDVGFRPAPANNGHSN